MQYREAARETGGRLTARNFMDYDFGKYEF